MIYDIIGDVHGQSGKLEALLNKLGYMEVDGFYRAAVHERRVVFVGDLIDGEAPNRGVIDIAKPMVENGAAHIVMGNHEYNAICYHTRHPERQNDWLRPHSENNNRQHDFFLQDFPLGVEGTVEVIDWFKTMPLYLEFENFNVIHGCWDQELINKVQPYLNEDKTLKSNCYANSVNRKDPLFDIIERLLKGVELRLPNGRFKDKYGKFRQDIRVKWWGERGLSYKEISFGYGEAAENFPDDEYPESSSVPNYGADAKPVFFGHYWMRGVPQLQRPNVCCVDYSAGKGRKLVCYSHDDSDDSWCLSESKFTWVD